MKIVRIMEFESHFEKSLRSQGAGSEAQGQRKHLEEEDKISPMELIKGQQLPEATKESLRIKGAKAISDGVDKMISL